MRLRALSAFAVVSITIIFSATASAQAYPSEPIRMVTSLPGGTSNVVARQIAQELSIPLKQPVVVDGRPGVLAVETVAKARPDGYTLLLYGSVVWIEPLLRHSNWDPIADFAPITTATLTPFVIAVHPSLPVKSVKELITLAKARPGELNYGSASPGSPSYFGPELFKSMAGVKITGVLYKGDGPALNDLLGGHIQMVFAAIAGVMPQAKEGKLRLLGVASARPSELLPDLPTVSASGLPGFTLESLLGVMAPAKTPAAIVNRLNQEIRQLLTMPKLKEQFLKLGSEPTGSSPQEFEATIRSDMAKWGKLIQESGIRIEN